MSGPGLLDVWAALANLMIALGYVGIGLYVAPRFVFRQHPGTGARVAKWSGIVFFVTCAISHLDLALHAATMTPVAFTSVMHLANHTVQAIAAPMFLLFASIYLRIHIGEYVDE